jgi:hypothetical protein
LQETFERIYRNLLGDMGDFPFLMTLDFTIKLKYAPKPFPFPPDLKW